MDFPMFALAARFAKKMWSAFLFTFELLSDEREQAYSSHSHQNIQISVNDGVKLITPEES